jgi:hypothetical protein
MSHPKKQNCYSGQAFLVSCKNTKYHWGKNWVTITHKSENNISERQSFNHFDKPSRRTLYFWQHNLSPLLSTSERDNDEHDFTLPLFVFCQEHGQESQDWNLEWEYEIAKLRRGRADFIREKKFSYCLIGKLPSFPFRIFRISVFH